MSFTNYVSRLLTCWYTWMYEFGKCQGCCWMWRMSALLMNIDDTLPYTVEWHATLLNGILVVFSWGRLFITASFYYQGAKAFPLKVSWARWIGLLGEMLLHLAYCMLLPGSLLGLTDWLWEGTFDFEHSRSAAWLLHNPWDSNKMHSCRGVPMLTYPLAVFSGPILSKHFLTVPGQCSLLLHISFSLTALWIILTMLAVLLIGRRSSLYLSIPWYT